jgi:hypothetical protein
LIFTVGRIGLRNRRSVKGQILVLVLLVLIGLVVVFALFSSFSGRVRAAPIVKEAVWTVGGSVVTRASVGNKVDARVEVQTVEEYVGSVVVKVRKDIRWWPDADYHVSTIPLNMRGGETTEIEVAFTPDEASSSGMRGYFIEIEFQATRTTWTMENTYPPRLIVVGATD